MRKLYGSTNWRRLLALVLVFAMLFSAMGTSGYSAFADSQDETGEAVDVAEPEVVTPYVTEDIQGPSPGEDAEEAAEAPALTEDAEAEAAEEESEETVEAEAEEGEEPEESEAVEEGEEIAEPAEEAGEDEEIAEPVEEAGEDEEIAEPVEEAEEDEEIAEPAEEIAEEEEPAEVSLVEAEEPVAVSIVEEFKNGLAEELATPSEEVVEPVEAAEEAEPAEEPEIAYPAWIDVKGFINGTTVTINAEAGTFPEGTEMVLSEVNTADIWDTVADALDAPVVKMRAVDITFLYGGEEIQPLKPISVKMNASGYDADAERSVVHIDDAGEADVIKDADTSKKAVEFEAEHFSVYVLVATEVHRLTVNFMNGSTAIDSMIIKDTDTEAEVKQIIYDPGAGTVPAGLVFKGWTTDPEYTSASEILTIEKVRSAARTTVAGLTEDASVTYYAAFFRQFTVTYVDATGIAVGTEVVEIPGRFEEASYKVNQGYSTDDHHNFEGWLVATGLSNITDPENATSETLFPNGTTIKIKGDVKFSVSAPEGHWLVFRENGKGGKYNAPQFVLTGENTKKPCEDNEMTRYGYTFDGWYNGTEKTTIDEFGKETTIVTLGDPFTFGNQLEDNTTIFAKWNPKESAPYTVIFWTQKQDKSGYEVEGSYANNNGVVGENIPYTFVDNGDEDYVTGVGSNNGHYTGFCLTEACRNKEVKITPEGDAVLNLYYDRITYNFKFYLYRDGTQNNRYDYANNSGGGSDLNGLVTWHSNQTAHPSAAGYEMKEETVGGRTYHYFTITAYYGQDINDIWPTYDKITGANNRQPVSYVMMVGTKLKPNATDQGSGTVKGTISVMNENILGATNNANGNYVIVRFPDSFYNWRYHIWLEAIDNDPAKVPKDENGNPKPTHTYGTGDDAKLYYEETVMEVRSSNTTDGNQNQPKYSGFDYVTRMGQNQQGVWGGGHWRTNENGAWNTNGNYYHLNYIYNRQVFKISYFDGSYVDGNNNLMQNKAGRPLHESAEIEQGNTIDAMYREYKPALPEGEEGFVFEGWFIDEGCTEPYVWSTMPVGGITVFAKWRQIQYRVFLHPLAGAGTLNDPVDQTLSWGKDENGDEVKQEMNFRISYGGTVSVPTGTRTGYEFYGWYTDKACSNAYPSNSALNERNVTTPYDNTVDMTDVMDMWGNGATYNKDHDFGRFWITKKLDLYAKWSEVIVGAYGISVVYDANGGSNQPTDGALYKDNTGVSSAPATTAPEGKVFDHWKLQKWNGDAYVDKDGEGTTFLPGETFKVYKADAKIIDKATNTLIAPENVVETGSYIYTVQVKAVYKDIEKKTPTHIYWYKNDGTSDKYREDNDISINAGVAIYGLGEGEAIPSRKGYTFKGWAKSADATVPWLAYSVATGYTYNGTSATQVAADERPQIEDLYALWAESDVTINYAVASDSTGKGSVGRPSETIKAISGSAAGSEAIPGSNYLFDYWTCDDGTEHVGPEAAFVPEKNSDGIYEAHTYYAHFKEKPAMGGVTVHHYLLGTTAKVADDVTVEVLVGEAYTASPKTTYDGKHLTVASYDPKQTITVQAGNNNVITIYYTLPLTVTATTASKPYDSTPLNGGYTATGALAADEETIANAIEACIEETPSVTNVTEEPLEYFTEEETSDLVIEGIPEYYVVTYESGSLAITPAKITVTADDKTKVYKAEDPELTATIDGTLYGEDTISYTLSREKGEEIGPYIITPAGEASQGNYEVTFKTGTLRITGEGYVSIKKEVTSTPKNGDKYALGEEITYKITVKNEGQTVTINNIKVEDELVDKVWTIESLAPGATYEITDIKYTVTEEDILAGSVVNVGVISEGTPVPPDTPDNPPETPPFTPDPPIEVIVETEAPRAGLSITKEAVSSPALSEGYALNETVKYQITVQNTGNVTLTNVTVTDTKLKKQTWIVGTYDEELETYTFAPGATYTLPEMDTTYIVAEADVTAGEIVNVATVTGKGPAVEGLDGVVTVYDPDPATDTETVPTTAKTPVKTLKVAFYTNYPDEVLEKGWINEYSATKEVPTPYEVPGFVTVFDSSMIPDGFKTESWEVHKPAKASGGTNDVVNADESTVGENGMASTSSSSNGTRITEEPSDVDIIFYALWEEDYRFVPSGGTHPPKDPDPDPDPDPEIDDEPTPLSPFEEIPEEDLEEPDTPYAGWEEEPDEEISEEPTPLSPYTGDDRHTAAWGFVSLLSLAGIAVLGRKRREEE